MPARKQRWEPMLNMAGKPVIDPTHQDIHPKATFEAAPGYDKPYSYPAGAKLHYSADTVAEMERPAATPAGDQANAKTLAATNAQGTLFAERPYAKGYSPERGRRIDQALKHAGVLGADTVKGRPPTPEEQQEFDDTGRVGGNLGHKYGYSRSWHDKPTELIEVRERGHAAISPKIGDAIKRSNVPGEHLQGLSQMQFGSTGQGIGAYYSPGVMKERGSITFGRGDATPHTAAHEIGHHVDNVMHGRGAPLGQESYGTHPDGKPYYPDRLPYGSASSTGRAEGFADSYAHAHVLGDTREYAPGSIDSLARRTDYGGEAHARMAYVRERNRWGGVREGSEWETASHAVRALDADVERNPGGTWIESAAGAAVEKQRVHQWVPGDQQRTLF